YRRLEAALQGDFSEQLGCGLGQAGAVQACLAPSRLHRFSAVRRLIGPPVRVWAGRCWLRRCCYGAASLAVLAAVAMAGLAWRLANGPIDLDLATPWLTAAIGENFGSYHQVSVE